MIYLSWSGFILLEIYRIIFSYLNVESWIVEKIKETSQHFRNTTTKSNVEQKVRLNLKEGDYILLHCGIARIIEVQEYCIEVEYIFANFLVPGEIDVLPEHLIIKKLDREDINKSKSKISKKRLTDIEFNNYLLEKELYIDFWKDLY